MMERQSGLLLPLFSLASPWGIGTLGQPAFDFVDFLAAAGQSWWQLLPLGPTGYGDSPYQSFSSFAGSVYYLDPALLYADGLLTRAELQALGGHWGKVDYGMLYASRPPLLQQICARGWERDAAAVQDFRRANPWVEDHALYQACKAQFAMRPWYDWPDEGLRRHRPEALDKARRVLDAQLRVQIYGQFLFDRQWRALRDHAHSKGIRLLGDLPFYVAMDSADIWAEPQFFQLDDRGKPGAVAGVPPDYFSPDGQLWGNPLYAWDEMARDGWGWWIRRLGGAAQRYDAVRIDHFRAFDSYWSVPAGAATAKSGKWIDGPGMAPLAALQGWFPDLQLIAEDLGDLRPSVHQLRKLCVLPGMRVLQFAFDAPEDNVHRPHNYAADCVCYVGTHDNDTAVGWLRTASAQTKARAQRYLGLNAQEGWNSGLLRGVMASAAALCILRPEDLLGLGSEARTNTPGTTAGNWQWRLQQGQLSPALAETLRELTRRYGREANKQTKE